MQLDGEDEVVCLACIPLGERGIFAVDMIQEDGAGDPGDPRGDPL
jgi:hypothetical protein